MIEYICRVVDDSGSIKEVIIKASSSEVLETTLQNKNLHLLSFKKSNGLSSTQLGYKLKPKELLIFTQTINMLISANLSINDVVEIAGKTLTDKKLIELCKDVTIRLNRGENFSETLKSLIPNLPILYQGLITVGERTGNLKLIIKQLNTYLEREKLFRDKLQSAMIYPIFILILTSIFSILFITVLLPQFNQMFSTLGDGLGSSLEERGQIVKSVIIGFLLLISSLLLLFRIEDLRMDRILLKLPLIGKIILENSSFTLVFSLSVLSQSYLNIEESLLYTQGVISNLYLKKEVSIIRDKIVGGESLSSAFKSSPFPVRISSFIKVGEKTGNLNSVLDDLSNYFFKESNKRVDGFMVIIDPLFTLLIGGVLFTLILLFILPLLTKMGGLL
ncbi:type II secretion system F family protein [Thiospirochaeta perfilievii]|uniref:Type II secretion system F family protein n=1 Tax=Thiospirochaeta perfilievii TaxID=252967 RepID=A0A5C1QAI2_9SPIO|nr:type II secretion system F family protein [Thiospirochaeta perfilievii]QEN05065.1 type II secretion system F family protein [Thiospirochaeta perfilievii]